MSFSCNKVNSIVINTIKGEGYVAQELGKRGKVLEQISGKNDDPKVVVAFFKRMGYPLKNILCNNQPAKDIFVKSIK